MDKADIVELIINAKKNDLTRLDLSNRDIRELPVEIGQLSALEYLDLSYNFIQKLPKEIGNLEHLKTLLLLRNEIDTLPVEIGNLRQLNLLDISHNRFTQLPETIGFLSELKTLDASYGNLTFLPIQLIELISLKDLYLENNPLIFPPYKVVKRGLYATMYFLASEKRKIDSSRVIIQVFNMPEKIREPLIQYIRYFTEIVSTINQHEVQFDIKFIDPQENNKIEVRTDIENYLYDFLHFIQTRIQALKTINPQEPPPSIDLFDLQIAHLNNNMRRVIDSIDCKVIELKEMQQKMNDFFDSLEKKTKEK